MIQKHTRLTLAAAALLVNAALNVTAHAATVEDKIKLFASCSGYTEYAKTFWSKRGGENETKQYEKAEKYTLRYANELADDDNALKSLIQSSKERANKEASMAMFSSESTDKYLKLLQYCISKDVYYPLVIRYEGW